MFACIVPMLFIIFAALGSIFEGPAITTEINSLVDRVIPYPEYAQKAKDFLFSRVEEFSGKKQLAGIIGFIGLLFASSGLFSSMRTVLNTVFRAHTGNPIYIGKLRDLGLVLLVLTYFLLSTTILPTLGIATDLAQKVKILEAYRLGFLEDLALATFSFAIIYVAFFALYFFIPQAKLPKKVIAVSALAAMVLWGFAQEGFGFYISHTATLKRVYGAFTLFIVIALWIYYTSLVFIIAAEIGQLYRETQERRKTA